MKINILNIELEMPYDLTVADEADEWESYVKNLTEAMRDIEKGSFSQGDVIRKQIEVLRKWLDKAFGIGAGEKIFKDRENLKTVYVVYKIVQGIHLIYVPRVLEEAWKESLKQYSPERAQRKKK